MTDRKAAIIATCGVAAVIGFFALVGLGYTWIVAAVLFLFCIAAIWIGFFMALTDGGPLPRWNPLPHIRSEDEQ